MGEAGGVDGALVGVDHQAGETLDGALVPEQRNKTKTTKTLGFRSAAFNNYFYLLLLR